MTEKGTNLEQGEISRDPKMERLMDVLDDLGFPLIGKASFRDRGSWREVSELMRDRQFITIHDFEETIRKEVDQRKWHNKKAGRKIMGKVRKVTALLREWEKTN